MRHSQLRVCLSHGGGALPYLGARANHGFNVYPNDMQMHVTTPPDHYLKRSPNICADTLLHDPGALKLALDYFGEVRYRKLFFQPIIFQILLLFVQNSLMLGSDYPFLLGEHIPGTLIKERCDFLDEATKRKLLCTNALRFFNTLE